MVGNCFFILSVSLLFLGLTLATARGLSTRILEDARAEAQNIRQRAMADAERTLRQGNHNFGDSEGLARQREAGLAGGTVSFRDLVEDGNGGGRRGQNGPRDDGLGDLTSCIMNALANFQRGSHRSRRSRGGRGPRWARGRGGWRGHGSGNHHW